MIMRKLFAKIRLYVIDIPATLLLAPVGFIFEFMVTFPFMLACELDGFFKKKPDPGAAKKPIVPV